MVKTVNFPTSALFASYQATPVSSVAGVKMSREVSKILKGTLVMRQHPPLNQTNIKIKRIKLAPSRLRNLLQHMSRVNILKLYNSIIICSIVFNPENITNFPTFGRHM